MSTTSVLMLAIKFNKLIYNFFLVIAIKIREVGLFSFCVPIRNNFFISFFRRKPSYTLNQLTLMLKNFIRVILHSI